MTNVSSRPDCLPPKDTSSVGVHELKSFTGKFGYFLNGLNGQKEEANRIFDRQLNNEGRDWLMRDEVEKILEELFGIVRRHIESLFAKDVSGDEIDESRANAIQFVYNVCEGVEKLDAQLNVEDIRKKVEQELEGLGHKAETRTNLLPFRTREEAAVA